MDIELQLIKVRDLFEDYADNEEQGVRAYGGKLDVRPPYQREFVYKDKQRDAVIETLRKDFPLNVMYWAVRGSDVAAGEPIYEMIDGQQRTLSICQFVDGDFSIDINGNQLGFYNLQPNQQEQILEYELMVYLCQGTDSEKLDWFETINIAGEKLTSQELLNAIYHGPFVSAAKRYFSRSNCPAYQLASSYMDEKPLRQEYLETAIRWITNGGRVDHYMRDHQHDEDADALWEYFKEVVKWVSSTFTKKYPRMKSVNWGPLYNSYKDQTYDIQGLNKRVDELMSDIDVKSKAGIYQFVLGGESHMRLLDVRVFSERTKLAAYGEQRKNAEAAGASNCSACAMSDKANRTRIYELSEMDADHVTAWTKGGKSDKENCEMLCVFHNRSKGNR